MGFWWFIKKNYICNDLQTNLHILHWLIVLFLHLKIGNLAQTSLLRSSCLSLNSPFRVASEESCKRRREREGSRKRRIHFFPTPCTHVSFRVRLLRDFSRLPEWRACLQAMSCRKPSVVVVVVVEFSSGKGFWNSPFHFIRALVWENPFQGSNEIFFFAWREIYRSAAGWEIFCQRL